MTQEEKAKAYDNVREKIAVRFGSNVAKEIFSEYEEDEDERIRKNLISCISTLKHPLFSEKERKEFITWLEKQAEQKPADEVKPKFKTGDWILIDNPCQIERIDSYGNYVVRYCDAKETHLLSRNFCDSYFRLWTIDDAKDGDVLVKNIYPHGMSICLFKEFTHPFTMKLYCSIDGGRQFLHDYSDYYHGYDVTICPATKEQRDILIKAMADAGYTFDFEKKELKKIEQNHAEWSEEDEYYHNIILCILNNECVGKTDKEEAINWFKSLRPRSQWKPSAFHLECIEDAISLYEKRGINAIGLKEILDELKKLREEKL